MNKNIILVIIIAVLIGVVAYLALVQKPEAPPVTTAPDETTVKEVVIGFLEAKQSRDFENAKPFLSSDFAETIDPIEFAGTSNPHTGRFEIQNIQLLSDEKTHKVDARVYQEYTGEGDIGYNDNSYYVKLFGNRYLIDNIEYGKYVELPKDETADWKPCRNAKYGYEVKYPPDWKVWKPSAPEARSATCDEGLPIIAFSPNIYNFPNQLQINIDVSDQERLRGTIYEGSKSLGDYFAKNPEILKARPIVKETTIDGERLVWLKDHSLLSFHNGSIFEFRAYNLDDATLNKFLKTFKFLQ